MWMQLSVLRNAGVDLTIGPGAADAASVMSGFFWRMRQSEPEVTVVSEVLDAAPHGLDALKGHEELAVIGVQCIVIIAVDNRYST